MIVIQGSVRISPDKMDQVREAARAMIAATRAEDGCIAYTFAEDVLEPGLIHIIERWRDQAAITAHGKTPHMAAFGAALAAIKPHGLKVCAYDAAEERVLMGG
ncbi:MAG: antibiotic biosynthesis monooxygenase [Hydrogenophilaceae bacterium]|jgi:quinol monooxygenase YgiN|nr:antibiotic biosynthesis monooxygenase [Hydrogenophilaceae bacterium]